MSDDTPVSTSSRAPRPPRAALVLLAAGSGTRFRHATNKAFVPLGGSPVVTWSLEAARRVPAIKRILLVISEVDRAAAERAVGPGSQGTDRQTGATESDVAILVGGATRHESEWRALQHLSDEITLGRHDVVIVHDAARPLAPASLFESVIAAAARWGGAVPCRPQQAAISVQGSVPALGSLVAVQTPQAFRAGPLLAAYQSAHRSGFAGTDTASCVEKWGDLPIRCVPGPATNLKITYAEDLELAHRMLLGRGAPTVVQ